MINRPVLFTFTLAAFFSLMSCEKKIAKISPSVTAAVPGACDSVTYSKHIEKIITDECMTCHSAQSPNLSTYSSVKSIRDNGKLKTYVIDRQVHPMPPSGPLPENQLSLVKCWIENGGKEQ